MSYYITTWHHIYPEILFLASFGHLKFNFNRLLQNNDKTVWQRYSQSNFLCGWGCIQGLILDVSLWSAFTFSPRAFLRNLLPLVLLTEHR